MEYDSQGSDSEEYEQNLEEPIEISKQKIEFEDLKTEKLIVVSKSSRLFVAIIKSKIKDSVKVNILEQNNGYVFKSSNKKSYTDILLPVQDIIRILPDPTVINEERRLNFYIFDNPINLK